MDYSTYRNTHRRNANYKRKNNGYIDGNTVRKLDVVGELQKPLEKKDKRQNRTGAYQNAIYMNMGYVLFLIGALVAAAIILMSYIRLQSDIITSVQQISRLESQLNDMKLTNDEDYARAASSVDLEEIRTVAIGELGMRYAKEGQIINVSGEGTDYVRQLAEIQQ